MAKIIVGVVKVIAVRVDAVESVIAIGHPDCRPCSENYLAVGTAHQR